MVCNPLIVPCHVPESQTRCSAVFLSQSFSYGSRAPLPGRRHLRCYLLLCFIVYQSVFTDVKADLYFQSYFIHRHTLLLLLLFLILLFPRTSFLCLHVRNTHLPTASTFSLPRAPSCLAFPFLLPTHALAPLMMKLRNPPESFPRPSPHTTLGNFIHQAAAKEENTFLSLSFIFFL